MLHKTLGAPARIWEQPLTKLPHDCVGSYRLRAVWKLLSNSSPTRHSPLHSLGATLRYKALLGLVKSLHSSSVRPIRRLDTARVEAPVASWGPGNSLSGGVRQGADVCSHGGQPPTQPLSTSHPNQTKTITTHFALCFRFCQKLTPFLFRFFWAIKTFFAG